MNRVLHDPRAWGLLLAGATATAAQAAFILIVPGLIDLLGSVRMGQLSMAPVLAAALTAPLAGLLIDHRGRRAVLMVGLVLYALAGTVGPYLDGFAAVFASRLMLGVGVAGILTGQGALIGDYFAGGARDRLLGYAVAASAVAASAFMLLSVVLVGLDPRLPFALSALPVLLLPVLSRLLPEPAARPSSDMGAAGWHGTVALMSVVALLTWLIFEGSQTLLKFRAAEIGAGAGLLGNVISGFTLGVVASALAFGGLGRRVGRVRLAVAGYVLAAVGLWLATLDGGAASFLLGAVLAGLGLGLCLPGLLATTLDAAPARRRGLAVGWVIGAGLLGALLSPFAGAYLSQTRSLPQVIGVMAWLCLAVAGVLALTLRRRAAVDKVTHPH